MYLLIVGASLYIINTVIIMKVLNYIMESVNRTDISIKRLYHLLYIAVTGLYSLSLIFIALGDRLLPDVDTAYYWSHELFLSATYSMNIALMIFIFLNLTGIGQRNSEN